MNVLTNYPLIWMIIIGGAAGWLTGVVVKGKGYGCIGNVVVGIIGSVIGGWLFRLIPFGPLPGLIGAMIMAVIGAVVLTAVLQLLAGRN